MSRAIRFGGQEDEAVSPDIETSGDMGLPGGVPPGIATLGVVLRVLSGVGGGIEVFDCTNQITRVTRGHERCQLSEEIIRKRRPGLLAATKQEGNRAVALARTRVTY